MEKDEKKCPVCRNAPKDPVAITAGPKELYFARGTKPVAPPHVRVELCREHVKDLHIAGVR